MRRTGLFAGGCLVVLLGAAPAHAAPGAAGAESECVSAYKHAKELAQSGSLREARDLLVSCAKPTCSKALRQECEVEYNRLDSQIPTIVLHFTDKNGAPRTDVQVQVDGQPLTAQLDQQPLPVDPGVHEFTFKTADGETVSRKVMILENDRLRPIDATLAPAPTLAPSLAASPEGPAVQGSPSPGGATSHAAEAGASQPASVPSKEPPAPAPVPEEPEPPLPAGPPALPFILGGAGVVFAGTGAALLAFGKENVLDFAVDGLAIGAGAIVGAVWLLARPHPPEKKPAPRAAYSVDVHPAAGGAVASVAGTF